MAARVASGHKSGKSFPTYGRVTHKSGISFPGPGQVRTSRGFPFRLTSQPHAGHMMMCEDHGLARSMSRKGCGPDNARCEGLLGGLETGLSCRCDWSGATIDRLMGMLDAYLRWHEETRLDGYLTGSSESITPQQADGACHRPRSQVTRPDPDPARAAGADHDLPPAAGGTRHGVSIRRRSPLAQIPGCALLRREQWSSGWRFRRTFLPATPLTLFKQRTARNLCHRHRRQPHAPTTRRASPHPSTRSQHTATPERPLGA